MWAVQIAFLCIVLPSCPLHPLTVCLAVTISFIILSALLDIIVRWFTIFTKGVTDSVGQWSWT